MKAEIGKLRTRLHQMKKKAKAASSLQISKSAKQAKVERIVSELQQYLPKYIMDFIRGQIVRSQRMKTGVRWTISDKMLALSIFITAVRHIRLLENLLLCHRSVLCRELCKNLTSLLVSLTACLVQ